MTEASTPENTTGIVRRFIRPYPPGNVKFNAAAYPVATAGDLVITWATRNRKTQTALLVTQTDGSITADQVNFSAREIILNFDELTLKPQFRDGLEGCLQLIVLTCLSEQLRWNNKQVAA